MGSAAEQSENLHPLASSSSPEDKEDVATHKRARADTSPRSNHGPPGPLEAAHTRHRLTSVETVEFRWEEDLHVDLVGFVRQWSDKHAHVMAEAGRPGTQDLMNQYIKGYLETAAAFPRLRSIHIHELRSEYKQLIGRWMQVAERLTLETSDLGDAVEQRIQRRGMSSTDIEHPRLVNVAPLLGEPPQKPPIDVAECAYLLIHVARMDLQARVASSVLRRERERADLNISHAQVRIRLNELLQHISQEDKKLRDAHEEEFRRENKQEEEYVDSYFTLFYNSTPH
ncbi:uncharacterized protein PGTG_17614 [Puccinia graminis f. sp. tritici CRL 75-36-700-3]|uniref:Uncharacterized protein n=1 Tax=Puccinia graminis f. sp. tritici (strain CRL 75-36-700-3 / race SCCL) TaxID=418459 RepID=E3L4T5_PUCGT|nr:uncharacterized protein PGTG_17614 [Puccinia graminis f. sp. tritici CRL 75-36-700-3]EFP91560.2 hypothetical protein PGTG_17614 [Puccinia graminis f. sp. tritici CRL 75-36-700-3]